MDKIFLLNLEKTSTSRFLKILKQELQLKFKDRTDPNYANGSKWGLPELIEQEKVDSYQLIYVNNQFWSGSGGIIRQFNNTKIYQAGFRGFADSTAFNRGLGSISYTHKYNTKYQVDRAVQAGCQKVIMSFNLHNEKLFTVTRDYHLPKVFGKGVWKAGSEPVQFNGVPQWLLTMSLV